jgi:two-component system, LuxR family, sensor kinase FixL
MSRKGNSFLISVAQELKRRPMKDHLSIIYAPANRTKLLVAAGLMGTTIAAIDWWTEPYISLGFLYLFPIMIVGGFLSRKTIIGMSLMCAVLDFSNLPKNETPVHIVFSAAGFIGTGLFVSELIRNRRMTARKHLDELGDQMKLRRDAEEQLQILVESSPAAIVTIDLKGKILLANEAAQQLLAPAADPLQGQPITSYLPALQTVVQTQASRVFRTALQCRGQRSNGEAFLAGIWFSTYSSLSGARLAAIVVDMSEDLRNREDLSLNHLLKNSRILMAAVAHEVRNLCSAMLVVHKNLSSVKELERNEDFQALSTLIQSLEKVSAMELRPSAAQNAGAVDLTSVLDELRVLIDTAYRESDMSTEWQVPEALPLVWADRYGLVQVFLNLAKNSQRAMQSTATKRLRVTATEEDSTVVIRFEDTGVGISSPDHLFRPFQRGADSTGLGLYMSRAIMRSFGGELVFEPRTRGCCFAIVLHSYSSVEEPVNA